MSTSQPLCSNVECQVESHGKCKIGHDPVEQCPHYAQAGEAADTIESPPEVGGPVEIASGDVMHLDDLARFAREKAIRTVAFVGEQKAGKTTLLASIYAAFCRGRFAGLEFAGSRTLVGFAKRHHLALLSSGGSEPMTPRTSRQDPVSFFHLSLRRKPENYVNLILSDRSGEAYGDARKDTDLIQNLPELLLADRICFLLDGARLASKDVRTAYSRQFKQMIHAMHDNGALANAKAVEILVTKFDVTNRSDASDQKYLGDYEASLVAELGRHGLSVATHHVCALPKADYSVGYVGLEEALSRWTAMRPSPDIVPKAVPGATRQIDKLLAKVGEGA